MKKRIRAATRGEPCIDLETLKRRTHALCEEEFEAKWGEPFHKPGGGGAGAWLIKLWEADEGNKKIEDDARELYEKLRKRLDRVIAEAQAFRTRSAGPGGLNDVPHGAGGIAVQALYNLEAKAAHLQLPPISVIDDWVVQNLPAPDRFRSRRDGRAAFVARVIEQAGRPPLHFSHLDGDAPPLLNREYAVVAIPCGVTTEWASHARAARRRHSGESHRGRRDPGQTNSQRARRGAIWFGFAATIAAHSTSNHGGQDVRSNGSGQRSRTTNGSLAQLKERLGEKKAAKLVVTSPRPTRAPWPGSVAARHAHSHRLALAKLSKEAA